MGLSGSMIGILAEQYNTGRVEWGEVKRTEQISPAWVYSSAMVGR